MTYSGSSGGRRFRLVALDVDGTLIERGQPVLDSVKDAICRARQAGVVITLASGRMYPLLHSLVRYLDLTSPVICYGGAMVTSADTGEPLYERGVPLALTREVIQEARDRGLSARVYVGNSVYVDRIVPNCFNTESLRRVNAVEVGDLLGFISADPSHLAIDAPENETRGLVGAMRERFRSRLNVTTGHPLLTEFSRPGVHKGSALAWLCGYLGISIAESLAVGDDWNDIEMLQAAGLGVAVGNAHPDVLAIAGAIVPCVGEGGVAVAIDRFVLRGSANASAG
jgi:Cof subfamily protein (haloacid dehalogenase superfamily)